VLDATLEPWSPTASELPPPAVKAALDRFLAVGRFSAIDRFAAVTCLRERAFALAIVAALTVGAALTAGAAADFAAPVSVPLLAVLAALVAKLGVVVEALGLRSPPPRPSTCVAAATTIKAATNAAATQRAVPPRLELRSWCPGPRSPDRGASR